MTMRSGSNFAVRARKTLLTLGFEHHGTSLDRTETYKFFTEYVRDAHYEIYVAIEISSYLDVFLELSRYFRLDSRYKEFRRKGPVTDISHYMTTLYGIMENRVKDIRRNP